jgi:hypothetical protein
MVPRKHEYLARRLRGHRISKARREPTGEVLQPSQRARRFGELQLAGTRGVPGLDIDWGKFTRH